MDFLKPISSHPLLPFLGLLNYEGKLRAVLIPIKKFPREGWKLANRVGDRSQEESIRPRERERERSRIKDQSPEIEESVCWGEGMSSVLLI